MPNAVLDPSVLPISTSDGPNGSTHKKYSFAKARVAELQEMVREMQQERVSIPVWGFTLIAMFISSLLVYSFTAGSAYREINAKMQRVDELIAQQKAFESEMVEIKIANRGRDDQLFQLNLKIDELLRRSDGNKK